MKLLMHWLYQHIKIGLTCLAHFCVKSYGARHRMITIRLTPLLAFSLNCIKTRKSYKILSMLLTALFPRYCVGCERKDSALCDECISMIESAPIQQCVVCKKISPYGDICRPCRKNEILDISIDGLFYGFDYNNHVIEKIITAFKYRNNFKAIDMLYARFVELLERARFFEQFNEYVLSPMPLHRYHFNKRGFSQTDYLCEKLSRDFCIPIARPLVKIKNTPKQTKLKKEKRLENVRDVFETRDEMIARHKNIILFDDVYTTGATINEAARVLKNSGIKNIWGLVIARTL